VAAENRHGVGPESQAVTTRTLEEGKQDRTGLKQVSRPLLRNIKI
jgi:hypothetical protein